ncbi:conjugative transfer system coupling protein TraD [Azomonas macrocytogenes]|uniref:Conjugal transfer pilus assembly protein TraD n=1 Tax=Azomonas macrocytogenes TaxID=69962 RepID=A0A839TCB4_AZOMA|nr:conjugative transfer system coupling protein TraD [Azomonas macrocytogenes]MBB3105243.1 conjugal transfer pilus assembly protein TraD [Azomonas macrocytogenes]
MGIEYDALHYDMPWRKNYEMRAACGWGAALMASLGVHHVTTMPSQPFYWMAAMCGTMAMVRLPKAFKLQRLQKSLSGRALEFVSLAQLKKNIARHPNDVWLGYGFEWENRHAQRVFEILKRDISSITHAIHKQRKDKTIPMGQPWIHGVEPKDDKLYQPIAHAEGHTLLLGTTGSGKTRAFDILISQAILRGEAVIILDPKGDKEMRDNARRACESMGQPERFVSFHPGFPEKSCRIDPLFNFSRATEIASRLAALIPSESGNDPFTSFGWQSLNNIAQGLLIINSRPNLMMLRRYLESGAAGLVSQCVESYAQKTLPDWEKKAAPFLARVKPGTTLEQRCKALMDFYYQEVQPVCPSIELEGLLSMHSHDTTHFSKMVATLLPIMNMLTSGELGKMLSPDPSDTHDTRLITDSAQIINRAQVAYIGLDSLTDGMVASAIGSILLSDMTSVAGDRYNYGVDNQPVNLFIDEAEQALNNPTIQLLNKGRGAKFRLVLATQTIPDFTARLGSEEKALQVLGNINNLICLRVTDNKTQQYVTDNLPKTRLKSVQRSQGQNTDGNEPIMHGGNQAERLTDEEGDLLPPQLLGMLPNLEYVAKISGGRILKGRLPILTH